MERNLLTVVTATVDPAREAELEAGFHRLLAGGAPDGLLRTELLRGPDGAWAIHSLWRDRAALVAMRQSGEPPAAPRLFESVGAQHSHTFYEVAVTHTFVAAKEI
jgi:heme-degrading monooxygenase HmoA